MRIKLFYIVVALTMLLIPTISTQALELDQGSSFTSEPSDAEITANETLSLSWKISGSATLSYEIYMTQDTAPELIIAQGNVEDNTVVLKLNRLVIGSYIFSFKLLGGSSPLWSNVTITVIEPTSPDTGDGGSDDSFLPGFQFISLLGLVAVVIINKKRN